MWTSTKWPECPVLIFGPVRKYFDEKEDHPKNHFPPPTTHSTVNWTDLFDSFTIVLQLIEFWTMSAQNQRRQIAHLNPSISSNPAKPTRSRCFLELDLVRIDKPNAPNAQQRVKRVSFDIERTSTVANSIGALVINVILDFSAVIYTSIEVGWLVLTTTRSPLVNIFLTIRT